MTIQEFKLTNRYLELNMFADNPYEEVLFAKLSDKERLIFLPENYVLTTTTPRFVRLDTTGILPVEYNLHTYLISYMTGVAEIDGEHFECICLNGQTNALYTAVKRQQQQAIRVIDPFDFADIAPVGEEPLTLAYKTTAKKTKTPDYYLYKGNCYKKPLSEMDKIYINTFGHDAFLKKYKSYIYIAPVVEEPINEKEESIINIVELANWLTEESFETKYNITYNQELHSKEYETLFKFYIKNISKFKRTANV